jgi:serine phosphatase RsbU (regulator of sigma subunit)/putative methionine-R-sulfoxide reductase with GAF domain
MNYLPEDTQNTWKTFLQVGDRILQTQTTAGQYRLICETINNHLNAEARIWFSDRYYPLPGDMEIPLLSESSVPGFVWQYWLNLKDLDEGSLIERNLPHQFEDNGRIASIFPIRYQKNYLALLLIERHPEHVLTNLEIDFLDGLLTHAAIALQTYRLNVLKNWRHDQLTLVRSISAKIATSSDLGSLFQEIIDEIQKTYGYYSISIFSYDPVKGSTRFRASSSSLQQNILQDFYERKVKSGIVGRVAVSGEEIYIPDVINADSHHDIFPETRSHLALPLKVESEVLGVLEIENNQPLGINENDLLVLRSLADSIALAIDQGNLFEDLQRHAGRMAAVVEVGNVISSILDFDALMNEIVRIIQNRFGYPFVHIFTVQYEGNLIVFEAGTGSRSVNLQEKELAYEIDDLQGIIPWVARSNKTLVVNDVASEPLYRPSEFFPKETLSEIAVPLSFGGKVLGVLDIQSDSLNAFDDNDRFLFEALGATVAIAMRNASLYRTEQWRRSVADGFRDIAGLIGTNLALDQLLSNILDRLETYMPCDASAIWLLEQDEHSKDIPALQLAAAHCVEPQVMTRALQQSVEVRRWLENAALISEATIRTPKDAFCPLGVALEFPPDYSSIAAPLQAGDNPLGILTVAHHKSGRYNIEARAMTSTFASYAAVAIQNSRLFNQAQEQAWISNLLLQIAETIQTVESIAELFKRMSQHIPLLVQIKNCAFFLKEENGKSYVLENMYGEGTPSVGSIYLISDAPLFARLPDYHKTLQPVTGDLAGFIREPHEILLLYPLTGQDTILGAFSVTLKQAAGSEDENGIDRQTLALLQGIVNQVSISLENLGLIERSQQDAYVTAALLQVARAVVSQNELDDILATIVQLIPILVGVESCLIYLWDENRRLFHPGQIYTGDHQRDEALLSHNFKAGEFKLLDTVRKQDNIIHCPVPAESNSPLTWKDFPCISYNPDDEIFLKENKNWLIGIPLSVKGNVFGVLLVHETGGRPFHDRRLEILTGIAQQTALSIQNDMLDREIVDRERLESEFELALQVQKTFLPEQLPGVDGWDMDVRWQPARQVGGDFYDIFDLGGGQLGLVIADVSDKGIPAALYMTVTRTLIRASLQTSRTPAEVLELVNQSLVMESLNGMFVTTFFAILSTHTGKLIYANAGHNQPMILRKSGRKIDILEKGGMALGITREYRLENRQVTIHEDDTLVLFTDGVTESFSPSGEAFGDNHLREALLGASCSNTNELLTAVEKAASDFRAGRAPTDDMTLVGIKRNRMRQKKLFSR